MVDLITEHIATWTAAEIPKANGGRGRGRGANGHSPHGIKKLRELILELAVRGKLVAQDPTDEPASVLLGKIAKEKGLLIKEGKNKKEEPLPVISEVDKPFDLPEGWAFSRFIEVLDFQGGSQPPKSHFIDSIQDGYVQLIQIRDLGPNPQPVYVPQDSVTKFCAEDDIMIGRYGASVGKVFWGKNGAYNVALIKLIDGYKTFDKTFLYTLMKSPLGQSMFLGISRSAQDGFSKKDIEHEVVPIPPLAEQHHIVAKVDELMALCDKLEQQQTDSNETHQTLVETLLATLTTVADPAEFALSWQRIEAHFDTLFTTEESIDQLKHTILQLAVMGKLAPQDPNDEPASTLLEKIAKEKARLIKEGKIKKQKSLPEINVKEVPFELPQGWAWARFPELGEFGRGKSKHRPRNDQSLYSGGKYPMVQTGDVARATREIKTYTAMYNDKGLAQSRLWPKGTMCITIAANIADSGILGFEACFPDSVVGLIPSKEIEDSRYFEYFMRTAKENLMAFAPSTAQKNINLGILETVYIPLPPAEEIKRIVAKVDELMALCDTLKERLHDAQTTQVQLADAIVEQAVT